MGRKYHIIFFLLMSLILLCTGCQKKIQEEPKVVFQDPVFQAIFDREGYREKLGSFTFDTILPTQSQLNQMTALNLRFEKGEECSLEDLKKFPNLRGLLISNANQSIIQQVSEQEQLKALYIEANELVDMRPIGTMKNIKALVISAPGEEAGKFDWSFIANMKQLETLYIEYIKLNDLDFLKALPNLKRLVIEDVEIGDISALATLSNLKYFTIYNDNINDYSAILNNMNHIEQLSLERVKMTDWSFLQDMRDLNWLSIRNIGNVVHLPQWLLPENYPNLNMLDVDDDILNTNRELLDQIMPVLDERKKEKEPKTQFYDSRINVPGILEYMEPVEIYDD